MPTYKRVVLSSEYPQAKNNAPKLHFMVVFALWLVLKLSSYKISKLDLKQKMHQVALGLIRVVFVLGLVLKCSPNPQNTVTKELIYALSCTRVD